MRAGKVPASCIFNGFVYNGAYCKFLCGREIPADYFSESLVVSEARGSTYKVINI